MDENPTHAAGGRDSSPANKNGKSITHGPLLLRWATPVTKSHPCTYNIYFNRFIIVNFQSILYAQTHDYLGVYRDGPPPLRMQQICNVHKSSTARQAQETSPTKKAHVASIQCAEATGERALSSDDQGHRTDRSGRVGFRYLASV